ncbi:MAG: hypothetical protein K5765_04685 [Clostridia bacterium]|nr:hypothetical protein [Clostridia bacterium]
MKAIYNSEIQGMIDFWNELGVVPDYELNTDGRYNGNLVEFKLVYSDLFAHKEQIKRYIKSYNSAALPIPKYSYLISINERLYIKIDNETNVELEKGSWDLPDFFKSDFVSQTLYIKGWIDELSIVAYNNKLCQEYKKYFKSKEDVKNEFINPKFLNIEPFDWYKQIKQEELDSSNIGWLHFNMNMLGPSLLKKQLGAFFTPDRYVKIATEMVREAIRNVPEENDYIILDRCAGTGNLERFLHQDELAHCVLNTIDYTEWTTLKGLYDGRVKMIIPPTRKGIDISTGLLTNGDALSEEFYNFCFHTGQMSIFDQPFEEESKLLRSWLCDEKMTIIMLENPPFVEPQGGAAQGKQTFQIKDAFLYQQMGKDTFDKKNANRDSANLFIWSAFKYYLKDEHDSYILFSPIKYWKSQHIIDKKIISGYLCNREHFNATAGGISLIEWRNVNQKNEMLKLNSDLGERIIKKHYENPLKLMVDSKDQNPIAWLFNLSNVPKPDNGKLVNYVDPAYRKVQKPYALSEENILQMVPLWAANCYECEDYTEVEVVMKSADGGNKYTGDTDFLLKCFLWGGITRKNKCYSDSSIKNEYCFLQLTRSDKVLTKFQLKNEDSELLESWRHVFECAKFKNEFHASKTYGLCQIDEDINVKIGSGQFNKKGEEIMVKKYLDLDESINQLKKTLKEYYHQYIKPKLFEYELLK